MAVKIVKEVEKVALFAVGVALMALVTKKVKGWGAILLLRGNDKWPKQ